MENPSQVCLNSVVRRTYNPNMRTEIHSEIEAANAAPLKARAVHLTKIKVIPTWMTKGTTEHATSGATTDCVWRNLKIFCNMPYANNPGIRNLRYRPAAFDIWGSWCKNIKIMSENHQRIDTKMQKKNDTMQDACRYIPNILYNFAP